MQRSLWRYYYPNTEVLILVVDSNDRERMDECRDELTKLMCEEKLRECCLLIMANKQDLPNAMSAHEMANQLDLNKLSQTCNWCKYCYHKVIMFIYLYMVEKYCNSVDLTQCATSC